MLFFRTPCSREILLLQTVDGPWALHCGCPSSDWPVSREQHKDPEVQWLTCVKRTTQRSRGPVTDLCQENNTKIQRSSDWPVSREQHKDPEVNQPSPEEKMQVFGKQMEHLCIVRQDGEFYKTMVQEARTDEFPENKLYQIFPVLKECISCPRKNRKEETVMARLHIGHSFITHSFLLKELMCIGWDKPLTIEHILLTCSDFIEIREPLYS